MSIDLDRIKAIFESPELKIYSRNFEAVDFRSEWTWDEGDLLAEALNATPNLIAEVERLTQDNEATDGTDAAHPSYWRGCDATFSAMSEQLRKILDGEDDCSGVCQEPWDTLRRRVLALRSDCFALATHQCKYPSGDDYGNPICEEVERLTQELANAKAVGAAEELERMAREDVDTVFEGDLPHMTLGRIEERAAELRKGSK